MKGTHGVIACYRRFLPITKHTPIITLHEGNSPLLPARTLSESLRIRLFFKYEGVNPTASFKDRGMTVALSKALEAGARAVICASTGNTSASAAAYAAAAGLPCYVILPKNDVALGKLAQTLMYGAKVIAIRGRFDDALAIVRAVTRKHPEIALVNSLNPYRLEGQKTAAFEVCDVLGEAPAYHALPVGNAGNITAYWMGYQEYRRFGKIRSLPKMLGFQAKGADPIVRGHPLSNPTTVASAIRIGNPVSWKRAEAARDESRGLIASVTDHEIIHAYRLLAKHEGIFIEPASAAGLAGILKLAKRRYFPKGATVVVTLTGHGLKDPDCAVAVSPPLRVLPATEAAVLNAMHMQS